MPEPATVVCPVCWGTGHNVDVCDLCVVNIGPNESSPGTMPATGESVDRMFQYAATMMANIAYQGPSEKLIIPLGWEDGDYLILGSENSRHMLVNAEAMIVMAHAVALADKLKEAPKNAR